MLDLYCERTATGLWAEPFNLITNLAFLWAAWSVTRSLALSGTAFSRTWDLQLLVLLLAAIGIGSGLWHGFASAWAQLADVLPITLFMAVYLLSFLARVARLTVIGMISWLLLFEAVNLAPPTLFPAGLMNGSLFYLPAWLSLCLMWLYCRVRQPDLAVPFLTATLLFTCSLTARTVDNLVCPVWPIGTHFLWHLLNAELLRRLILALPAAPGPLQIRTDAC